MIRTYRLPPESLRRLEVGASDAAARKLLRSAQLSKHLLLVREIVTVTRASFPEEFTRARLADGVDLLARVQRTAPAEANVVLAYPYVGAWAVKCLRRMRDTGVHITSLWTDLAHLCSVAAAAAVRANVDFAVPVPVRAGMVFLPTLGSATVSMNEGLVTARGNAGRYWIDSVALPADPHEDGPGWYGLRRLPGRRSAVMLDDIDPFRPTTTLEVADRLPAAEADRWRERFSAARNLLEDGEQVWADEVDDLLVSVVPLQRSSATQGISATSRDAFGSFSATLPPTDEALAVTLIHEGQHNKLSALLALVPMLHQEREHDRLYYSPWRADPRPAHGLLQGCYAFLSVVDFWRVRSPGDQTGALASFEFARTARQVRRALRTLRSCRNLTVDGRRFVQQMSRKAERWNIDQVPVQQRLAADDALDEHWIAWCLANRFVDPRDADSLADAWLTASGPPERLPAARLVASSIETFESSPRLRLTYVQMADPRQFESLREDPVALRQVHPNATIADVALVERSYASASRLLGRQLVSTPRRFDAWVSLALADSRMNPSGLWHSRPELVQAVYGRVNEIVTEPPDPNRISEWLALGR